MPRTPTSDTDCQTFLDRYSAQFDGYMNFTAEEKKAYEAQNIYATYGELLFDASCDLLRLCKLGPNDVFYDLGSGIGRLCAQAFLTTDVGRSVGIEIVHDRAAQASHMEQAMRQEFPDAFTPERALQFLEANFLDVDISDATVLYTCSTAFSKELVARIAERAQDCKNLRYFLSLRPSPFHLPMQHDIAAPCTWGKFTHCYIYGPQP